MNTLRKLKLSWILGVVGLVVISGIFVLGYVSPAQGASGEVVILSTTSTSQIISAFNAAGKTVVSKTPTEWSAMTAAEFDAFDAIVLGDPRCRSGTSVISAAIGNAATWGSVVDGNVIIIGTDEQFHASGNRRQALMNGAAAFVVDNTAGKTGAYISLSCYYHGTAPGTPLPMLDDAFGSTGDFTVTGVGCFNDAHIVATHPAFTAASVADSNLSNWSCSVHEAFDNWPITFEVLAIARNIGAAFTAPDGSVGTPYILARGVTVISDITLSPDGVTNDVGDTHTLTATVTVDTPSPGTPVVGTLVTFEVIAGPHAGTTGTGTTDSSGMATFGYVGASTGIDTIEATFVDGSSRTQRSNRVTKEWVIPPPTPTPTPPPTGPDEPSDDPPAEEHPAEEPPAEEPPAEEPPAEGSGEGAGE